MKEPQKEGESSELQKLREQNEALQKQLAETQTVELPSTGVFPGNITVLQLLRDEYRNPIGYEEKEVPEELANEQLRLSIGERNPHWRDLCFKEQADQRFLK